MKKQIIDVPTMAKLSVVQFYANKGQPLPCEADEMFVVWSCKTLQNWKAILSFAKKGAPMFEVTHDGSNDRTYVDVYSKIENYIITGGSSNGNRKNQF